MASSSRGGGGGGALRGSGAQVACQYHPDARLVEDQHAGDLICTECGLVVVERCVDVGSECRTFGSDNDAKDNSRVGAAENTLLYGSDLSTTISMGTGAASLGDNGRPLYTSRRQISSDDRALLNAFREIADMADRLHLPEVIVNRANTRFKQVHESQQLNGHSNGDIAAACLYIACREEHVPRTFKEICAVSNISKDKLGRVFKLIVQSLSIPLEPVTATDFIPRFCGNLGLSRAIQKAAIAIATKANEIDLVAGQNQVSVSAAAIYMASQASNDTKQAKEIGDIAGVADSTIFRVYKIMLPKAHQLFPDDFKFMTPIESLPVCVYLRDFASEEEDMEASG